MTGDKRDTLRPPVEVVDDHEAFSAGRRLKPLDITGMTDRALLELIASETYGLSNSLHRMFGLFSIHSVDAAEMKEAVEAAQAQLRDQQEGLREMRQRLDRVERGR